MKWVPARTSIVGDRLLPPRVISSDDAIMMVKVNGQGPRSRPELKGIIDDDDVKSTSLK